MVVAKNGKTAYRILGVLLLAALLGAMEHALPVQAAAMEDTEYVIPGLDEFQEEIQQETQQTEPESVTIYAEPESEATSQDLAAPADEVSILFNGTLDDRTDEVRAGNAMSEEEEQYVLSKGELAYDRTNREYLIFCGDRTMSCNYPANAIVSAGSTIRYSKSKGLVVTIYKDGEVVDDSGEFHAPGTYTLHLSNTEDRTERSISFIILKESVSELQEFTVPEGFDLKSCSIDGEEQTLQYKGKIDLVREGFYRAEWSNERIRQYFVTEFRLDLTPPSLELPQIKNGIAKEPVTFTDLEEGAVVYWKKGDKKGQITDPNDTLEDAGSYVLTVRDAAGNETVYEFEINLYLDRSAGIVIAMLLSLPVGLFLYCRWLRKNMRVA